MLPNKGWCLDKAGPDIRANERVQVSSDQAMNMLVTSGEEGGGP